MASIRLRCLACCEISLSLPAAMQHATDMHQSSPAFTTVHCCTLCEKANDTVCFEADSLLQIHTARAHSSTDTSEASCTVNSTLVPTKASQNTFIKKQNFETDTGDLLSKQSVPIFIPPALPVQRVTLPMAIQPASLSTRNAVSPAETQSTLCLSNTSPTFNRSLPASTPQQLSAASIPVAIPVPALSTSSLSPSVDLSPLWKAPAPAPRLLPAEKHQCQLCNYSHKVRQVVANHISNRHANLSPYICKTCGAKFPNLARYYNHNKKQCKDGYATDETCMETLRRFVNQNVQRVASNHDSQQTSSLLNTPDPGAPSLSAVPATQIGIPAFVVPTQQEPPLTLVNETNTVNPASASGAAFPAPTVIESIDLSADDDEDEEIPRPDDLVDASQRQLTSAASHMHQVSGPLIRETQGQAANSSGGGGIIPSDGQPPVNIASSSSSEIAIFNSIFPADDRQFDSQFDGQATDLMGDCLYPEVEHFCLECGESFGSEEALTGHVRLVHNEFDGTAVSADDREIPQTDAVASTEASFGGGHVVFPGNANTDVDDTEMAHSTAPGSTSTNMHSSYIPENRQSSLLNAVSSAGSPGLGLATSLPNNLPPLPVEVASRVTETLFEQSQLAAAKRIKLEPPSARSLAPPSNIVGASTTVQLGLAVGQQSFGSPLTPTALRSKLSSSSRPDGRPAAGAPVSKASLDEWYSHGYRFKCSVCSFMCKSRDHMEMHIAKNHVQLRPISCDGCSQQMCTLTEYFKHCNDKHKGSFENKRVDYGMLRELHQQVDTMLICLDKNMGDTNRSIQCGMCGLCFPSVNVRRHHVVNSHVELWPFTCNGCGIRFKSTSLLSSHHHRVHQGSTLSYETDTDGLAQFNDMVAQCCLNDSTSGLDMDQAGGSQSFDGSGAMVTPSKTVKDAKGNKVGRYRFVCLKCGHLSTEKAIMEKHVATLHCDLKHVSCGYCNQPFNHASTLWDHTQEKHAGMPMSKIVDPTVGHKLNQLLESTIGLTGVDSSGKYKCKVCGLRKKGMAALRDHITAHYDIWPLVCTNCHLKFKFMKQFYSHSRGQHPRILPAYDKDDEAYNKLNSLVSESIVICEEESDNSSDMKPMDTSGAALSLCPSMNNSVAY